MVPLRRNVSIIIPTHNGRNLLERYLPSFLKAVHKRQDSDEIIVVDDGSTDDTIGFLKENYPSIKAIRFDQNQGFSRACNRGFREAKNDIVILLNNDVEVSEDFIQPLLEHFENDDELFAVTSKILVPRLGMVNESVKVGFFRRGIFYVDSVQPKTEPTEAMPILYASGCCSAYDREKFLELGGFDELYAPYYWEDVDISYRAWKRGWKVLYEPRSVVYHQYQGTIAKSSLRPEIELIRARNNLLFTWKNITDFSLIARHALSLAFLKLPLAFLRGDKLLPQALGKALGKLPQVLKERGREKATGKIPDKKLVALFGMNQIKRGAFL